MPNYCYKCAKCQERFVQNVPVRDRNSVACATCGTTAQRDWAQELGQPRLYRGQWPLASDALGVHPAQIAEARAMAEKHGVPTEFTRDGRAILRDAKHRRRYARLRGYHDLNAGYSDPVPA